MHEIDAAYAGIAVDRTQSRDVARWRKSERIVNVADGSQADNDLPGKSSRADHRHDDPESHHEHRWADRLAEQSRGKR